jgi:hypothetical protein
MPPFEGNNSYRGIVTNGDLPFKKNTTYELQKIPRHNWRKFMLSLVVRQLQQTHGRLVRAQGGQWKKRPDFQQEESEKGTRFL